MDFKKDPKTDFEPIEELSKDEAREEVQALREGIRYHDYRYYVQNNPVISDATYDKLFARLEALESAYPDLRSDDSPTLRVGSEPVSKLKKRRHAAPMLSLEAVRKGDEVKAFLRRLGQRKVVDLEPKFDGFSVEVVYEHGHFSEGATRGNGDVGEDISHNLKTVRSLPLALRNGNGVPERLAVRGEVFLSKKGFLELNRSRVERGDEPFANPRNAAAGIMRQLDSRKVADKPLDIFFYEILDSSGEAPGTHHETLERFSQWGLKTCPLNRTGTSFEDVQHYHEKLLEQRDDLDFEIDGIVIEADDHERREALGVRSRSPRWALAWKFAPRERETTLEEIVVSVGRTGMLTPVALLQPVDVGGVTVSRATLHNEDEVHRKDVRAGDTVRIMRAGDVIPEVEERVPTPGKKRGPEFAMPERCPVCNTPVVREGAYHICPAGLACTAQLVGHLIHYASRDAMDIEHLGEKTARQLVEREMVHDLADLYALTLEDLESLEGFAERSARQLHDAIQGRKRPRLDQFLYSLGIRHVGRRTATLIAAEFSTLEALRSADQHALDEVNEIGPEIAASVADFFADQTNRRVLDRLLAAGIRIREATTASKGGPLAGQTIVFTGSLHDYTRKEAQQRVESLGARASSSVSGETDLVVVGDDPGSKLEEARKHGVKTVGEKEFRQLIGEGE